MLICRERIYAFPTADVFDQPAENDCFFLPAVSSLTLTLTPTTTFFSVQSLLPEVWVLTWVADGKKCLLMWHQNCIDITRGLLQSHPNTHEEVFYAKVNRPFDGVVGGIGFTCNIGMF